MDWEYLSIRVERIENGFLLTEGKGVGYEHADNGKLFYPTMEVIERELVTRLRAAAAIDTATAKKEDF
jgi:hypothetical protein